MAGSGEGRRRRRSSGVAALAIAGLVGLRRGSGPGLVAARRLAGAALLLLALAPRVTSGTEPAPEYAVKAAFLCNFARFVQWPAGAFASADDPIVLCVAGEDPFGRRLDRAVAGRTAQGRGLLVRRSRRPEELGPYCHILFVGAGEDEGRWLAAVRDRQGTGALTVGEGHRFASQGSIAFVTENRRVQFQVNLEAAGRARLRVSARLLALARVENPLAREGSY